MILIKKLLLAILLLLVVIPIEGCFVKTRFYTNKYKLRTPIEVIEPFVLIRYLDSAVQYDHNNFYSLPIDTATNRLVKEKYILPLLKEEVYKGTDFQVCSLDTAKQNYLKMLIAKKLIGEIKVDRYNRLIQNYSSEVWKKSNMNFQEVEGQKVLFTIVGGAYDRFPDNSCSENLRRFNATFFREKTGDDFVDKDFLPFTKILIGIFNIKSFDIEYFAFRENFFDFNQINEFQEQDIRKLMQKLPPVELK